MIPPLASRFVAGETAADAIDNTEQYRDDNVGTILNLLGEHYTDTAKAESDTNAYQTVLDYIHNTDQVCISIKPSQLGADIDPVLFKENLTAILETATENNVFVWCDMEDSTTTEMTVSTIETLAPDYPDNIGLCLQANLKRTAEDIERLAPTGVDIRLVKGAYTEETDVAFTDSDTVDKQYKQHVETLCRTNEGRVAVGTHDPEMIGHTQYLMDEHDRDVQFQLLLGVREDEQRRLAENGYDVWQYAPYGKRWPSYVYRRIREGRKNIKFMLRALVSSD